MFMMLIPILSFLSGLMLACSTLSVPEHLTVQVDTVMHQTVFDFLDDCEAVLGAEKCKPRYELEGGIRKLENGTLGTCYVYDTPAYLRKIYVDKSVEDPDLFRVVMYHELMHCILDFQHHDDGLDIMNSTTNADNAKEIAKSWDEFVNQALKRGEHQ